ncbi:MAG TPA: glycosyltransferase family 1 protein [Candidatus Saccharimonadales bacterium]
MKIFFDARWTQFDHYDGISRYGSSLAEALHALHPITLIISDERQLKLLPKDIPYVKFHKPISLQEFFVTPRRLNELGADVVFNPLQVMGFWGRKYKLILTLQDIIYYRHPMPPRFLSLPVRIVWRLFHMVYWPQRLVLNRADYVATVSHTSKKYIEKFRLTNRPVGVVYNAPQPAQKPARTKKPTKDILYMGSFMPYKNVELLIAGMQELPDYTLHLLSKITPERKAELKELTPKGARVKFWNGVSEQKYYELLSTCTVLASASREEGFGLSIIEAMDMKTPVVCSDIEIFHEVAGDAALFFNPDSASQFAQAIRKLESPQLREHLAKKGTLQAQKFSWRNSATELLAMMEQATGSTK